ncbi:MAG TPA: hypothetical protein VGD74_05555 [Vulgatibacter sp.]
MKRTFFALLVVCLPFAADAAIPDFKTAAVSVTTTRVKLRTSLRLDMARQALVCVPSDAAGTVYVGDATVTAANGIPVEPGKCYASGPHLASGVELYGIVASGTVAVRVQESY